MKIMNKFQKKLANRKKDNKGFSLVELIIVIAIMAILVGVLAPQYLKYVEKSRRSADLDQLDSVYTACTTAASDADITDAPVSSGSSITGTSWYSEVENTVGTSLASLKWKSSDAIKGTAAPSITVTSGQFTVSKGALTVSAGSR